MNALESYIVKVISVKPYKADWTDKFVDKEFLEVDVITNCYGRQDQRITVVSTEEWEDIKSRGYFYFWW